MLQKIGTILFIFLNVSFYSFGQSDINSKQLSLAEHALLDFITSDSVNDLSLDLFKDNLKFGVPNKLANGTSIIKKKDQVYLQLLGSGRLYKTSIFSPRLRNIYIYIYSEWSEQLG